MDGLRKYFETIVTLDGEDFFYEISDSGVATFASKRQCQRLIEHRIQSIDGTWTVPQLHSVEKKNRQQNRNNTHLKEQNKILYFYSKNKNIE